MLSTTYKTLERAAKTAVDALTVARTATADHRPAAHLRALLRLAIRDLELIASHARHLGDGCEVEELSARAEAGA